MDPAACILHFLALDYRPQRQFEGAIAAYKSWLA